MALAVLMLRKKIDLRRKALEALMEQRKQLDTRSAALEADIEAVETEDQQGVVEEAVTQLNNERSALEESIAAAQAEVDSAEEELRTLEAAQNTEPTPENRENVPAEPERRDKPMNNVMMTVRDRLAQMVTRDDVKAWLDETRSAMREKRALTNVGLTIPEVMLGMLREKIEGYSKLYKHLNVKPLDGTGRLLVMGSAPEGVWTECCAALNELTLGFNDFEVDCYKVGGYFAVCNATIEDSNIALASELVSAIGQAIGLALDKAIIYGRNAADKQKMPLGIVTRLAQTEQPSGYPSTARAWVDLHSSNIKTIANSNTGINLFKALMLSIGASKGKYAAGGRVHVMNETTFNFLKAEAMSFNAAGAIVSGMENTMPVIGGTVELLDFMPDYVIVSGYFDNYLLAERAGKKFATSEHVRFLQDQTVFKGTARYDGGPAIAEAFVAIAINGASVSTDAVSFEADDANSVQAISLNTATASVAVDGTVQLFAITSPGSGAVTWTSGTTAKATVDSNGVVKGVAAGSSVITATCNGLTASCTVTVTSA